MRLKDSFYYYKIIKKVQSFVIIKREISNYRIANNDPRVLSYVYPDLRERENLEATCQRENNSGVYYHMTCIQIKAKEGSKLYESFYVTLFSFFNYTRLSVSSKTVFPFSRVKSLTLLRLKI